MSERGSWWLKFDRAQYHRREAEAMVASATAEQDIRMQKVRADGGDWIYTVHHDAVVDPSFPAVLGDFLFNLRSALDHIAAANRLKPTAKSPFPLFHDPIGQAAVPGEPTKYKSYRNSWAQVRANTNPAAFKAMDAAQPFNAPVGVDPTTTALAVLNHLQNRDKHASLTVVTSGIKDIECWVVMPDGDHPIRDPKLAPGMFPNGADIFHDARDLDIRARGSVALSILAGPNSKYFPLPLSFEDMADEVALVLQSIETAT